jgi:hypothetical protein
VSELKEYSVDTPVGPTTFLLSDEDAKARGLAGGKARETTYGVPENNTDTGQRETASADGEEPVRSKARSTENK